VSDKAVAAGGYYIPEVLSAGDYYPFGMGMVDRRWSLSGYRYGFNGKENDNEVKGEGNEQDYGMRVYDPRIGRFLSEDPLIKQFPHYTPYQFSGNTPIQAVDLDGAEERHYNLLFNQSGRPYLKMTSEETVKHHSLFGFKWTTPIHAERADINYNGTHYYIGYSGIKGTGNQNKIGDFHKWAQNPHPDGLKQFLNEDQSGGAFYTQTAVNLQNNILMYGALTQKAWFTRLDDKCFVAGTKILINDGLKNIENILVGDSVWSFNEMTHEVAIKVVISRSHRATNRLVKLNVGDEVLWTTPEHPFWINSNWVIAENIQIGDSVLLFSNVRKSVSAKAIKDSTATVYNFSVADFHTYYVSSLGILVHNTCFEPVTLRNGVKGAAQLNRAIKDVEAGGGTPRLDANGNHTVFQGRTGTNGRAWAGALEYEVLVPGTPNQYRILKQQTGVDASGVPTYRYGYSTDHYRTAIHEFKPVQSTPPPPAQ
jgi:RHS repeat-associated protein